MKTVLVVDDDERFLKRLCPYVREAGFRVLEVTDGQKAAQILDRLREKISLLVVDLVLPGMNGFELIGAVTRRATLVRVIATTGVLKQHFLEVAKYLGAHAVLRKPGNEEPFPVQNWIRTIGAVLEAERSIDGAAPQD